MRFDERDFLKELNGRCNYYYIDRHLNELGKDVCDNQGKYDFFEWMKIMQSKLKKYFPQKSEKDLEQKVAEIWVKSGFPNYDELEAPQHYAHRKRNTVMRIFSNDIIAMLTIAINYISTWTFGFWGFPEHFNWITYKPIGEIINYISWLPLAYLVIFCYSTLIRNKARRIEFMWLAYFSFAGFLGLQVPFIELGAEKQLHVLSNWLYVGIAYLFCTILYIIDNKREKEIKYLSDNNIEPGIKAPKINI